MDEYVAAPGPQTAIDPAVEFRLSRGGTFLRWLAAIYATLALISVEVDAVRSILLRGPEFLRALPLAGALPLALLAIGSLMAGDHQSSIGAVTWRRIGSTIAVLTAVLGVYVVAVYAISFPDLWPVDPEILPMPSLWLGLLWITLGSAVLLSVSRFERRVVAGQIASLLVFSTAAVIFLGYLYNDVTVGRLFRPPELTFQATLVSLLIAVGVFLIRPGSGVLAVASSPGPGGRMLRIFGPVALFMPALLLLAVETVPVSDRRGAVAFISVGLGLFLMILLAFVVRVIDETKREALTSAAEAARARIGLEQEAPVVQSLAEALHLVDVDKESGLDVATRFRPGRGSVAGDSSSIRTLPDGTVCVVLVDMTGHGADPSVRAIRVRDILVHSLALGRSPAEAMGLVGWSAPGDVLASAIVAKLEPGTGEASFASAGHPPAVFVGRQQTELLEATGPLLYLDHEASYGEVRFELRRGDSLVVYSDGVADVQRERNGRPEPSVLADALLAEGGDAARGAELVLGFASDEPSDDQTVLVVRRRL